MSTMTKFERAIAKLQSMPVERRELMLDAILGLDNKPEYKLTDEQLADLDLSIKEADAGIFASDEEMAALWKSFGL
jgi:hypothetical protein